jgi:hypothetical protein
MLRVTEQVSVFGRVDVTWWSVVKLLQGAASSSNEALHQITSTVLSGKAFKAFDSHQANAS